VRPLIMAKGLLGKRVEPDLAGTMITKESVI
jgi:hypothetical protein